MAIKLKHENYYFFCTYATCLHLATIFKFDKNGEYVRHQCNNHPRPEGYIYKQVSEFNGHFSDQNGINTQ